MIYEDLYRQHEQDPVMHRGVCAVELVEDKVDAFLRSLSKELREQADTLRISIEKYLGLDGETQCE